MLLRFRPTALPLPQRERAGVRVTRWVSARAAVSVALLMLLGAPALRADDDAQAAKDRIIVETITRLEGFDINSSEKAKAALSRHLKRIYGTEDYVDLISRFSAKDEADGLAKLALEKPTETIGVKAARLVLKFGEGERLTKVIEGDDAKRSTAAMNVLGVTGHSRAVKLLESIMAEKKRPVAVRSDAVRALGRSRAGELRLLELVKTQKLPGDLTFSAGTVLRNSADPKVRDAAAKHIEMPAAGGGKPLPPISELVKKSGDPARGKQAYMKVCVACHKAGDIGIDFGPALTEIGDKLPKSELYTSILDPSAGVSFDYVGHTLTMKDGSSLVGIIASETEDTISLKIPGGVTIPVEKSKLKSKKKMTASLMTPGLQAALTEQELVDLIEYLATLKKK